MNSPHPSDRFGTPSRVSALSTLVLVLSLGLCAGGCAGELAEPDRFLDPQGCDVDVQAEILLPHCGGSSCHVGVEAAGELDLSGPDLGLRLFEMDSASCEGRPLIDGDDPDTSYFLDRISDDPRCNGEALDPMPVIGAPLTPGEQACLLGWARSVAAAHSGAGQ